MHSKTAVTVLLLSISLKIVLAQTPDASHIDHVLDYYIQYTDEIIDVEELTEQLYHILLNPINLNAATQNEFEQIFFLTNFQIHSMLTYRKSYGAFISIDELRHIYGFNNELFELVKPFFNIEQNQITKSTPIQRKSEIIFRYKPEMEQKAGFLENSSGSSDYLGDKNSILTKAKINLFPSIHTGFVFEKDAGEKFINNKNKPEFLSAYVHYNKNNWIIIIGDYHTKIGQGAMLWTGFGISKSRDVLNISKMQDGISPYKSSREYGFCRGISINYNFNALKTSLFYSLLNSDATIYKDSATLETYYSSESLTGFHRTENELNKKNAIQHQLLGNTITYNFSKGEIQWSNLLHFTNPKLIPSNNIENLNTFSGNYTFKTSLAYKYLFHKTVLFGENVLQHDNEYAFINGAMFYLLPQFQLSALHRYISLGYWAPFSNAFREASDFNNEQGFYTGIKWNIYKSLSFSAYVDLFEFNHPTFNASYPSRGNEYLMTLDFSYKNIFDVNVLYKSQLKQKDYMETNENMLPGLTEELKENYRIDLLTTLSEHFKLRSRIEFTQYTMKETQEYGFIMFQDFICSFSNHPISFTYRILHYDTDGYNSRTYAYEPDVYQSFSVPFFYGNGYKHVLLLQIKALKNLTAWLKLSLLDSDTNGIGSGNEFISGKIKKEGTVQIRYTF